MKLPSDIWREIALASLSDGPLITDAMELALSPLEIVPYPEDRRSIAVSYALVCKSSNHGVRGLLWDYISVRNAAALSSVVYTLSNGCIREARKFGPRVKRLDISISGSYSAAQACWDCHFCCATMTNTWQQVLGLVEQLPNLQIMFLRNRGVRKYGLFKTGLATSLCKNCPDIRRLQIAGVTDVPSLDDLHVLGKGLPRLATLQLIRVPTTTIPEDERPSICFPELRTLWFGGSATGTWAYSPAGMDLLSLTSRTGMELPKIHRLDVRLQCQGLPEFIRHHGHKITTLTIGTKHRSLEHPGVILTQCPNLQAIRLCYEGYRITGILSGGHPELRTIIIAGGRNESIGNERSWPATLRNLDRILSAIKSYSAPKLSKIIVEAYGSLYPADNPDWWWNWLIKFSKQDVRFEIDGPGLWPEEDVAHPARPIRRMR
ncbi:hypothetical protein DFP72DRAFT_856851 [Ephemerocybe angulata]|uniref:Uncharacterized protein n=1 Tax=Ephemerocybe angulata TaxID=980116 RepID=A0A8H6HDD2_9AGAR|nr:hypothetical protein DFP72DRAFT_856851 [Tulosesus angulatus]